MSWEIISQCLLAYQSLPPEATKKDLNNAVVFCWNSSPSPRIWNKKNISGHDSQFCTASPRCASGVHVGEGSMPSPHRGANLLSCTKHGAPPERAGCWPCTHPSVQNFLVFDLAAFKELFGGRFTTVCPCSHRPSWAAGAREERGQPALGTSTAHSGPRLFYIKIHRINQPVFN